MTTQRILKLIFTKDTIALIAALVFLWFTISLLVDSNLATKDLIQHTGQVQQIDSVIIRVKDKPLFKQKTRELHLTIDTQKDYFTSITQTNFNDITSVIKVGDTITVFTKPRLWGIFVMKKKNAISQLTKGKLIIIDFEKYKETISSLYLLTLAVSIIFFVVYIVRIRRRLSNI